MSQTRSKRDRILLSAEKIMSRRGEKATISEIARDADVFESTIYYYFKNKEDLLFSVAEERTRQWFVSLEQQLEGIHDPVSRIGKLIWWQLYRFDVEDDYSSIVLFQCRSRRNFYTHKAFERITSLRILFEQIMDEGRRAGVFRKDIHNSALWHIIFGLTDVECLMSYRFEGTRQAHGDLDGIMDVILPMITLEDRKGDRKQDKTGKILKAAERVFAEKGFEHAKIQEIAKQAGVADGSIYDYFSSKDELLFSIIQDGFLESPFKKGFKAYLPPQKPAEGMDSPVEKMKRFIRQLLFLTLIQPDFAKILVLHGIYNQQFYGSTAFECFLDYLKTIDVILEEGKTAGLFRKTAVNRIFRNLVLGMFSTNALRWFLQDDGHKRDKVKEIETLVTYMIRSIIRPEKIDLV